MEPAGSVFGGKPNLSQGSPPMLQKRECALLIVATARHFPSRFPIWGLRQRKFDRQLNTVRRGFHVVVVHRACLEFIRRPLADARGARERRDDFSWCGGFEHGLAVWGRTGRRMVYRARACAKLLVAVPTVASTFLEIQGTQNSMGESRGGGECLGWSQATGGCPGLGPARPRLVLLEPVSEQN